MVYTILNLLPGLVVAAFPQAAADILPLAHPLLFDIHWPVREKQLLSLLTQFRSLFLHHVTLATNIMIIAHPQWQQKYLG